MFYFSLQSNRSQPAIGLKQTPKSRVSQPTDKSTFFISQLIAIQVASSVLSSSLHYLVGGEGCTALSTSLRVNGCIGLAFLPRPPPSHPLSFVSLLLHNLMQFHASACPCCYHWLLAFTVAIMIETLSPVCPYT